MSLNPRLSKTKRTARSRTSGENLFVVLLMMLHPPQKLEPPANPGRFSHLPEGPRIDVNSRASDIFRRQFPPDLHDMPPGFQPGQRQTPSQYARTGRAPNRVRLKASRARGSCDRFDARLCCTKRPEVEFPLALDRVMPRVEFAVVQVR